MHGTGTAMLPPECTGLHIAQATGCVPEFHYSAKQDYKPVSLCPAACASLCCAAFPHRRRLQADSLYAASDNRRARQAQPSVGMHPAIRERRSNDWPQRSRPADRLQAIKLQIS
ncbi:MAG: hypothetical protein ACRYGK_01235 [Janthinobacterium lividum]